MRATPILALLLAGPALAEPAPRFDPATFDVFGAGILCASPPARQEPAPGTISGFVSIVEGGSTLGLATSRVPALPGLAFGIVGQVGAVPREGVTVIVTHPPMGEGGVTVESWTADYAAGGAVANFFRFDEDYERVPGPWRMEAVHGGKTLYAVDFEVVDPAAWPDFLDPCERPPAVS